MRDLEKSDFLLHRILKSLKNNLNIMKASESCYI